MLSTEQHGGANDSIIRHASKSEEQTDARGWRRPAILFVIGAVARRRSAVAIGVRLGRDVDVGAGGVVAATPMAAVITTVVSAMTAPAVTGRQRSAGDEGAYRDCQPDFGGEFADSCAPGAQTFVIRIF